MKLGYLATAVILLTGSVSADERAEPPDAGAIREAIAEGLPFLAADARAWMDGRIEMQDGKKCVSCHYVSFGVWSHQAASLAGVQIDKARHQKLNSDAAAFISDPATGRVVTYSHLMMANPRPQPDQHRTFVEFAERIVGLQESAGFWKAKGQFPSQDRSVMESNAVATMWAIVATRPYAGTEQVTASRAKALKWLRGSKPGVSTEWHAWRVIVSHQEQEPDLRARVAELIRRQNADGSFSWLQKNPGDAYTTGQVLYALLLSGHRPDSEPVRGGLQFLLKTQNSDGTWTVPSKLVSAGPDQNKDQIYTYWGTAWATIALAHSQQTKLATR